MKYDTDNLNVEGSNPHHLGHIMEELDKKFAFPMKHLKIIIGNQDAIDFAGKHLKAMRKPLKVQQKEIRIQQL